MAVSTELVDVTHEPTIRQESLPLLRPRHGQRNRRRTSATSCTSRPAASTPRHSRAIAEEIAARNRALLEEGRPYVLIGFGRWGSADPWLGVPVAWGDVAGAKVLVEASRPGARHRDEPGLALLPQHLELRRELLLAFRPEGPGTLDWEWLESRPAAARRAVRPPRPPGGAALRVEVDGRTGRGIIWRRDEET